jgi:hypothetical protein
MKDRMTAADSIECPTWLPATRSTDVQAQALLVLMQTSWFDGYGRSARIMGHLLVSMHHHVPAGRVCGLLVCARWGKGRARMAQWGTTDPPPVFLRPQRLRLKSFTDLESLLSFVSPIIGGGIWHEQLYCNTPTVNAILEAFARLVSHMRYE